MSLNWLNVIGLIFDIIGVIMLFKYGLPSKVQEGKGLTFRTADLTHNAELKFKKYKFWAHVALLFLIIGFLLQFIVALWNALKTS